ncbi:exported hypothetical protein [Bradyrhizobium sp. ORS 375]|nr:exported hypothetical protein [Bradyrhizobium sp. ORS 375]
MRVLILTIALGATLGQVAARSGPGLDAINARDIATDRIEYEVTHWHHDDASPIDRDYRPAQDQRTALLRWGGCHRRDRVRHHRAHHQLHAGMADRACECLLSLEAMGAISSWRGPRGPPRGKLAGKKIFRRRVLLTQNRRLDVLVKIPR